MRSATAPAVRDEPTFTEAARRAQIIDCAIDAIAELGFSRASLAEIAKRARVSKSVVSYYFAGKDELIDQVVRHIYATGAAYMIPRIEAAVSTRGALRAVITSNVAFIAANQRAIRAVQEVVANWRTDDGSPRFDNALQDQSERDISALLRAGQERGEFGAFAPGVVAASIRASIDALSWRLRAEPDIDIAGYSEELADLYERATAPQASTRAARRKTSAGEGARAPSKTARVSKKEANRA